MYKFHCNETEKEQMKKKKIVQHNLLNCKIWLAIR